MVLLPLLIVYIRERFSQLVIKTETNQTEKLKLTDPIELLYIAMAMSRQYIVLVTMIVLMQVCLLGVRGLKIVRKSTVSNLNGNMDTATTDSASSCTPPQHQFKYYNKLYSSSTSAANSFNGNILY